SLFCGNRLHHLFAPSGDARSMLLLRAKLHQMATLDVPPGIFFPFVGLPKSLSQSAKPSGNGALHARPATARPLRRPRLDDAEAIARVHRTKRCPSMQRPP